MPFEPVDRVRLGRTGVEVTRLGFGGASIGGLFRPVADDDAIATVRRAWDLGIRYFDRRRCTATALRSGGSGAALARTSRATSTSCRRRSAAWSGRAEAIPPGADIDRQALDGRDDAYYATSAAAGSSSTTAPTASAGRSRRASSGSASTGSTSL